MAGRAGARSHRLAHRRAGRGRRPLCRSRCPPRGASDERWPRRAGAAVANDAGPRRERGRGARPRRAPAEGPRRARMAVPAWITRVPPAQDHLEHHPPGPGEPVRWERRGARRASRPTPRGRSPADHADGAGGSGKSRLAVATALELVEEFPNGVFFVELAPIAEPKHVAAAIAQVLGVRETPARPLIEGLKDHLADKRTLLVVDNFEHLLK